MIHVLIRYLGIKTKLLEAIRLKVDEVSNEGDIILDMFGGSNIVGQSLKDRYIVYSNDYQKYSYIVGKTLIEYIPNEVKNNISIDKIIDSSYYNLNKNELEKIFEMPVNYERRLLEIIEDNVKGNIFEEFKEIYNTSPYYTNTDNKHRIFDSCIDYFSKKNITMYKENNKKFPYLLFSTYYNNPYFSLNQCIDIDSIKYSIDKMIEKKEISKIEYNIYLSCLIYVLHNIVISVGDHFAQPQKIQPFEIDNEKRNKIITRERKKILAKKKLSVIQLFEEKLNDYRLNSQISKLQNKAFNNDYKDLFKGKNLEYIKNVDTIYIDPPYTNAHYSRFYHIPETLVLYDYPDIKFNGRYREDRYQSPFCLKTEAYKEFNYMLKMCKEINSNTIISYSDTSQCILDINEILEICRKYYGENVDCDTVDHMYRNFGQKPNKVLAKEYLITCRREVK